MLDRLLTGGWNTSTPPEAVLLEAITDDGELELRYVSIKLGRSVPIYILDDDSLTYYPPEKVKKWRIKE